MAARRNKRGHRRNRGRFGFLYKLLSALLIFAAILVSCIVFFRVDTVVVTGQARYTEAEIVAASGVAQGDNLFRLDKFSISSQIHSKLPYVDDLSISRKLPDTLVLEVTESTPIAYLNIGGEYWLVDAKCRLLERGDAALAEGRAELLGLTPLSPSVGKKLAVEEAERSKLENLTVLLAALKAENNLTGSIAGFIDLSATNEIRFGYGPNLTVVLPMSADFSQKAFALRRTLLTMDERGVERTGTLDLTYGDSEGHLLPTRWLPGAAPTETPATAEPNPETQGETNEEKTQ